MIDLPVLHAQRCTQKLWTLLCTELFVLVCVVLNQETLESTDLWPQDGRCSTGMLGICTIHTVALSSLSHTCGSSSQTLQHTNGHMSVHVVTGTIFTQFKCWFARVQWTPLLLAAPKNKTSKHILQLFLSESMCAAVCLSFHSDHTSEWMKAKLSISGRCLIVTFWRASKNTRPLAAYQFLTNIIPTIPVQPVVVQRAAFGAGTKLVKVVIRYSSEQLTTKSQHVSE
jgi:hypothetical protein